MRHAVYVGKTSLALVLCSLSGLVSGTRLNIISSCCSNTYIDVMRPIVTKQVAWSVGRSVCHSSEPCKNS